MIIPGAAGQNGVFGHPAVEVVFKTVDVVRITEPVHPALTVPALAAGDDLLGNNPVTNGKIPGNLALNGDDAAEEFMPGGKRRLHVGRHSVAAPEAGDAVMGLDIAGTDAAGFHLCQNVTIPQFGNGELFKNVPVF